MTLYDAGAFFKHRAEGETHSTFAYVPAAMRTETFRRYRDVLWALDAAWAYTPQMASVLNFMRLLGGPIHMTMRRYRYVEDGLVLGKPETEDVVSRTRQNYKLWHRVDARAPDQQHAATHDARYLDIVAREHRLLFPGLADILRAEGDGNCSRCCYRTSYGAEAFGQFGGVQLCDECRDRFRDHVERLPERALEVFPILQSRLSVEE